MKLTEIAANMTAAVANTEHGYVGPHPLAGGLQILLSRDGARLDLRLRRERTYPSDAEIRLCLEAFGVPVGTEPKLLRPRSEPHPISGRKITWYTVSLTWRDATPEVTLPVAPGTLPIWVATYMPYEGPDRC